MKSITLIRIALALMPFLITVPASATQPDFEVSMRIMENGMEVAAPRMLVQEDAEASVALSGEVPAAVGLKIKGVNSDEVHVLAEIETESSSMSPELLIKKGAWASVTVGDFEFHVHVEDHTAAE